MKLYALLKAACFVALMLGSVASTDFRPMLRASQERRVPSTGYTGEATKSMVRRRTTTLENSSSAPLAPRYEAKLWAWIQQVLAVLFKQTSLDHSASDKGCHGCAVSDQGFRALQQVEASGEPSPVATANWMVARQLGDFQPAASLDVDGDDDLSKRLLIDDADGLANED